MYCLFMRYVLTIGVMGLFSCLLAVSNSEPATRSEMSHAYRSSYLTAPLNSLGKTYQGGKLYFNTIKHKCGTYVSKYLFIQGQSLTLQSSLLMSSSDASGDRTQ